MAVIYGHRWISNHGERDDGTWLKGLQGLTPVMLAVGLEACVTRELDWPPSLPGFRKLCFGLGPKADEIAKTMEMPISGFSMLLHRTLSSFDWLNLSLKEIERRLQANYSRAVARYQLEVLTIEYTALTDQARAIGQEALGQEAVGG